MIQIISRIRHPELYVKMMRSARAMANGLVMFSAAHDDGSPRIAESYNILGATAVADIILFVHDDVVFLSKGWDDKIRDAMALGFNVVGAVGSKEYAGGMVFDAGYNHSAGKVVGVVDGKRMVKLMAHRSEVEPVKVLDGMLLAVDRKHFVSAKGFDWQFDGLFFYDLDLCLRSNCAVVDILVAHEKPEHMRVVYPKDMRPMSDYEPAFNAKHGFKPNAPIGEQRCDSIALEDYVKEAACL
jgi:hypothetical protein